MKKVLSIILLCTLLCGLGALRTLAADAQSGKCGETMTWTLRDGTLTVSGTGRMDRFAMNGVPNFPENMPTWAPWNAYRAAIVRVVVEEGVTSIGEGAFDGCGALREVELPASLKEIGDGAFRYCPQLERIQLPDGMTQLGFRVFRGSGRVYVSAGNPAFCSDADGVLYSADRKQLVHYPVNAEQESFAVPEDVREAESCAFEGCRFLRHVTVPGGIRQSFAMFYGCESLESAELLPGVVTVGQEMFHRCTRLRSVTLPDGLREIGDFAFSRTGLRGLHIPSSVETIDPTAFYSPKGDPLQEDLPYCGRLHLCGDSEDDAAKSFADSNQMRFYVCGGAHDNHALAHRTGFAACVRYILQNQKTVEFLSECIRRVGRALKSFSFFGNTVHFDCAMLP